MNKEEEILSPDQLKANELYKKLIKRREDMRTAYRAANECLMVMGEIFGEINETMKELMELLKKMGAL